VEFSRGTAPARMASAIPTRSLDRLALHVQRHQQRRNCASEHCPVRTWVITACALFTESDSRWLGSMDRVRITRSKLPETDTFQTGSRQETTPSGQEPKPGACSFLEITPAVTTSSYVQEKPSARISSIESPTPGGATGLHVTISLALIPFRTGACLAPASERASKRLEGHTGKKSCAWNTRESRLSSPMSVPRQRHDPPDLPAIDASLQLTLLDSTDLAPEYVHHQQHEVVAWRANLETGQLPASSENIAARTTVPKKSWPLGT